MFVVQVLEQILAVLLRLVKEFKLQHQHEYVSLFISTFLVSVELCQVGVL